MKYKGMATREIAFPIGGIGSGCISLAGYGRLVDWEIYNRPAKETENFYTHFAVKAECEGKIVDTRILQGDYLKSYMGPTIKGDYMGYGHGPTTYTMAAMPHFEDTEFNGEFPFAEMSFKDRHFPGGVKLTAFNPFIPLNEDDSSIPAAFFEVEFTNYTGKVMTYTAAFSCKNPHKEKAMNKYTREGDISRIYMYSDELGEDEIGYSDMTIATDCPDLSYQEMWYRAGWKDDVITYWRQFNEQSKFENRVYTDYSERGGDHSTLAPYVTLQPGETKKIRFILSWNVPNNYNYWTPYKVEKDGKEVDFTWKNYYAKLFKNSEASALYSFKNWDRLYGDTLRFKNEFFSQTLPGKIKDAIATAISVLKSPTVWRLEDGSLYGWEGCLEHVGACEGSCTHVWSYAYALCFLFPRLERSMRDLDYKYNYKPGGKMEFRMALPLGRPDYVPFHACVDGQMAGVFKTYRDWKICGDDEWLKKNWERVKGALAYAWDESNEEYWDRNKDGILEGRQHNTLDTELFSASSWLEGYYLLALKAASVMADYLGETEQADEYRALYANGKKYLEENLFNGKYYYQKIDLGDYSLVEPFDDAAGVWNEEVNEIKYQIGEGSEIDQVGAQWHSDIIGLGDIFDKERVKSAVDFMYHHNFKQSMREHTNIWRIYCLNDEKGAVICDYPEGARKPAVPLAYAEETMHAFEYMLAAQLISAGFIDKGLEVIDGVRDRYDGTMRNPFNEMECGNHYSRNMCTFSYIPILSGFEFDMPHGMIGFKPMLSGYFKAIWSLDCGWGNVECNEGEITVNMISGALKLDELRVPFENAVKVVVDGTELSPDAYRVEGRSVFFGTKTEITKNVKVFGA